MRNFRKNNFTILVQIFIVFAAFTSKVSAKDVIATVVDHAPYAIRGTNTGISIDIIAEALEMSGHKATFTFVTYVKLAPSITEGKSDIYSPLFQHQAKDDLVLSDNHFKIYNSAITLKSNSEVTSLKDLEGKRIVAFRSARQFLGADYVDAIEYARSYVETADHLSQNDFLWSNQADISIGGMYFSQYARKLTSANRQVEELKYNIIFEPLVWHAGFKDPILRDDFNKGLAILRSSGRYQKIIDTYTQ